MTDHNSGVSVLSGWLQQRCVRIIGVLEIAGRLAVSVIERFHMKSIKSRRPCWCLKTMKRRPMFVSQTTPLGVELLSYANTFFCSNKFAQRLAATWVKTLHSGVSVSLRGGGGVINGCPRDCRGDQTIRLSAKRWLTVYRESSPSIKILTFFISRYLTWAVHVCLPKLCVQLSTRKTPESMFTLTEPRVGALSNMTSKTWAVTATAEGATSGF